jgi:uncharacterized protein (TIGR03435 family)
MSRYGSELDVGRKLIVALALAGPVVLGITTVPRVEGQSFQAASIKTGERGWGIRRSLGIAPDGRLSVTNTTLKRLVIFAFDLQDYQVFGGPGWMDSDTFDIDAMTESAAGPEQARLMLRTLLAERFKLTFHRETREMPVFALTIVKEGEQTVGGGGVWLGRAIPTDQGRTLAQFAQDLSKSLDRSVLDKTDLSGKYELMSDSSESSIYSTPLPEQVGLKLDPQKAPVDVIVIDSAGKPSEN